MIEKKIVERLTPIFKREHGEHTEIRIVRIQSELEVEDVSPCGRHVDYGSAVRRVHVAYIHTDEDGVVFRHSMGVTITAEDDAELLDQLEALAEECGDANEPF